MRISPHWFLCLFSLSLPAATVDSDQEKLRSLLSLPKFTTEIGFKIDSREGFSLRVEERDPADDVAALQKSLTGELSDGPRYLQLTRAYDRLGASQPSTNALVKAIALGRQQLERQPTSPAAMQQLAEALYRDGKDAEAEALFRRAIKGAPESWRPYAAFGLFLSQRAGDVLLDDESPRASMSAAPLFLRKSKLPAASVRQGEDLLAEGGECVDQAVKLAPDDADARLARARFRGVAEIFRLLMRAGNGEDVGAAALMKALAPVTAWPDLRRALELRPTDARLAAIVAYFELFMFASNAGASSMEELVNGSLYGSLSEGQQQAVRNKLHLLEEIGQSSNATNAAAALHHLASLQFFVMRDHVGAERNLRRALALEPKRAGLWELLILSIANRDNSNEELIATAGELIKAGANARNFVVLAKAYDRAGQAERALQAAEKAVGADTNSFLAHHTLGVLLAKSAKDDEQLRRALAQMAIADKQTVQNILPADAVQFLVNAACCSGLAGNYEEGLKLAQQAHKIDPNGTDPGEAKNILQRLTEQTKR